MYVYLGVCVAFGTHVCGCPVSRIHKTTQVPAVLSQASLADSANSAQNLYLFICVMVCLCIFLYPLLLVRTQNKKMQPKNTHIRVYV